MKKLFLPILLVSISVMSCTTSTKGQKLNKDMVLDILEQFDGAIITRDAEVLSSLASEDLTYGHSSGKIQDKEEFVNDVVNGPFQFLSITNRDQRIKVSGNVAIVRHILLADAMDDGMPAQVRIGVVMVFQLGESGRISLLARQAFKI
ncbi:MAG: nuclear transport factor 2 family protein [Flavobacteriaceae bacterium]|nr:nuclear transport factor 2 family protein [Flavobacteriaceae bacterium]